MHIPYSEILTGLFLSAILTGIIGLERQKRSKSAGITTHMILGISTFAIGVMQREIALQTLDFLRANPEFIGTYNIEGQRLSAQVLTGIGFLGAGTIFKQPDHITGLTTAVTLWSAGVIGLIMGMGHIVLATGLAITIIIIIFVFKELLHMTSAGVKKNNESL
jgi:putative Mg2+ transporter-C (MgtC) family protein